MVLPRFPRWTGVLFHLLIAICIGMPGAAQTQSGTRPLITRPVDDSSLIVLRGNVSPLARPQFDRGPAPVSLGVQRQLLVLKRSPQRQRMLEQYLVSLEDKNSPNFHHFLSPEQFGQQYGPAAEDVTQVISWLNGHGFAVSNVSKGGMAIEFSGSVDQLQSAFHTQIHRFVVQGQEHVANITNPMIPLALEAVVAGVSPLNDFYPRPQTIRGPSGQWNSTEKRFVPSLTVSISNTPYLFVGPGDAATIYDAPTSLNANSQAGRITYDGSGVTIGIVTNGGVSLPNVQNYRSLFKLPPASISVVMDGNSPTGVDDMESTLDAEIAGAIAPGAQLVYYQAADTTLQSGVMLAMLRALDDNAVNILNVSYGVCELAQGATGNQEILNAMEQAAAQGIAVTVSSGDSGSAGCDNADAQTVASHGFGVNALASTPYAVAIGGTDFGTLAKNFSTYVSTANSSSYTSALGYIPESVWNDSPQSNGSAANNQPNQDYSGNTNIAAGGGGASSAGLYDSAGNVLGGYAKPAWQQQFETAAGVAVDTVRDVPDISLFAANGMYGALWATCGSTDCQGTNPTITGVGGTSASAPAFAGVLALINQKVGAAERLGEPNWVLYTLAKTHPEAFHKIASGNNSVVCVAGTANCAANGFMNGYNAGGAYNLATGLGSVDIASLVNNWTSVGKAQTSVSLTLSSTTFQHGQPVTIGIGVNPSAATGNVAITNDLSARGFFGGDSQLNLPLANGQAGGTWVGFPGGTYNVYASYGGDANYGTSLSTPVEITVTPEDSAVRLSVSSVDTSGRLQSLAGESVTYGTYVSVDAQPIGKSQLTNGTPLTNATGTISFSDTGNQGVQGSGMLDATGNAEFPTHYFGVGTHTVTASYWGDSSYNASNSAPVSFTVQRAGTVASVSTSASSINSGTLTITAAIRPSAANFVAPPPNGTVTFTDATTGSVLGTAGANTAVRDPTTGAYYGTASLAVPVTQLVLGGNNIIVAYNGDANFLSSAASAPAMVSCTAGCGNGTGQSLTLSFTQSTSAAAAGSSNNIDNSTMIVSVIPGGGFTGAVKLSCSVTGSNSGDVNIPTCNFKPGTVTITSPQSEQSTLTVTSTPAGTTTAASEVHIWSMARGGAMLACVLIFGLPGRRRSVAVFRVLLCLIALGTVLGGTTGCGGSSGTGGNPANGGSASTGTTPDRYTVTFRAVDAATGTITAQDSFTITVQ
jgi:trimeric autotransporter adhesin